MAMNRTIRNLVYLIGISLLAFPLSLSAAESSDQSRRTLEDQFKEALENAQFVGRWCLVAEGQLTEAKEEKYTIRSATKVQGETWLISARIQFGDRDVTLPVPVEVKWAGDTPVITVTRLGFPGIGTYSARVLVYEDTYAGTWSGSNHQGLLNGVIVRSPRETGQGEALSAD